jgi:hypothetical protein
MQSRAMVAGSGNGNNTTRVSSSRVKLVATGVGAVVKPSRGIRFRLSSASAAPACPRCLPPALHERDGRRNVDSHNDSHVVGIKSSVLKGALALAASGVWASPVGAAVGYNPEQGSETFKNIAGVGYIILVVFYFFRLFKKRADRATKEAFASTAQAVREKSKGATKTSVTVNDLAALDGDGDGDGDDGVGDGVGVVDASSSQSQSPEVTVTQCLIGVAQAGTICFGFYLLSRFVDDYFVHQELPDQYTARNVTLLIQSVVRGLVYLVTFIFGANATGLAALAVQLVVDPEGVDRGFEGERVVKKREVLPKVKISDDIGSLRRAFKEAERMGERERERERGGRGDT